VEGCTCMKKIGLGPLLSAQPQPCTPVGEAGGPPPNSHATSRSAFLKLCSARCKSSLHDALCTEMIWGLLGKAAAGPRSEDALKHIQGSE
jgi:hypothetical protein